MSDELGDPAARAGMNKGQSLVAAYRAARIAQRPNLRTELKERRQALRQERADKLSRRGVPAPQVAAVASSPVHDAAVPADAPVAPANGESVFASFLERADVAAAAPMSEAVAEPAAAPVAAAFVPVAQDVPAAAPYATAPAPDAPEVAEPPAAAPAEIDAEAQPDADPASALVTSQAISAAVAPAPLTSLGFGPGMIIRLSQLGIESVADLAAADPNWLRTALGDISRLINVDLWVVSARNAVAEAA